MASISHGFSVVASGLGNWAKQPFSSDMDVTGWALFVGLVVCLAISWNFVLHDVKGVV